MQPLCRMIVTVIRVLGLLFSVPVWAESELPVVGRGDSFVVQLPWLLLAALIAGGIVFFWLAHRRGATSSAFEVQHPVHSSTPAASPLSIVDGRAFGSTRLQQTVQNAAFSQEPPDSVEEEAEMFFLLGRMDLAIGVLRHYIESTGDAPAHIWMSLLDILHAQGLRLEFEKLALEITNHFNVAPPTWEMANERSRGITGLEHLPHLLERIVARWNEPDCADYLRSLLLDDRNGERGGFQMEVFRELLFLISLLEMCDGVAEQAPSLVSSLSRAL